MLYRYDNKPFRLPELTQVIDENGHIRAEVVYDKSGRVASSARNGGMDKLSFTYRPNEGKGSTIVTDALGNSVTYRYGSSIGGTPRITAVSGPGGACRSCGSSGHYSYDGNGLMMSHVDHNGNKTQYVWDKARKLVTARTEAVGTSVERRIRTQWHPKFRLPIKITEPGKQTVMRYDSKGRLLSRTEKALP